MPEEIKQQLADAQKRHLSRQLIRADDVISRVV